MLTVVTPATSRRLTTVEHVRGDLGLPQGTPTDDQIERLIDQATSMAETFCRRVFAQEVVRETFRGCYVDGSISLQRGPVASLGSVMLNGAAVDAADFELEGASLHRLGANGLRYPWRGSLLTVEYTAGFVLPGAAGSPPLPMDVERAAILLVGAIISGASRDPLIKTEDVDGLGSVSYWVPGSKSRLPSPEAQALLAPYRVLRIR